LDVLSFDGLIKIVKPTVAKAKKRGKVHRCTGTEALYRPHGRRGSRDIVLPFLDDCTRRRRRVSVTLRPLFTPEKDSVPILQEIG
jgi:hypothetical protein